MISYSRSSFLALFVLVGLLSTVGGAYKVRRALTILSPQLRRECSLQDRELSKGNWHGLLEKYHALLSQERKPAELHFLLGRLYLKLGLPGPARAQLEECLELTPDNPMALEALSTSLIKLRLFDEARGTLDRLASLDCFSPQADHCRVALELETGHVERACRICEKSSRVTRFQRALCYYLAGRLSDAASLLEKILLVHVKSKSARELLALCLVRQGRFAKAREILEHDKSIHSPLLDIVRKVVGGRLAPEAAVSYFQAQALPRIDTKGRRAFLKEALTIEPRFARARYELALTWIEQSRPRALGHLRAAVELEPDCPDFLYRLGLLLHDMGHDTEAVKYLQKASEYRPSNVETRLKLAYLLERSNRMERALSQLRRAINLTPTDPRAYSMAGEFFARTGEREKALSYLQEALLLNPYDCRAASLLAKLDNPRGDM